MARLSQSELIHGLSEIVGPDHISTGRADKIAYSADFWPRAQIWKMSGDIERYPPDCIVWPEDADEVAAILRFCDEHLIPVVPYGAGSGVCGGTVPIHGGVVVDVKRMRRIRSVDPHSMTIVVEAGMNGQHLEDELNARGYTLGHFPSSIMCSTVGGWLAARSGGQFSSRYGKIEDMVCGMRVALPGGQILSTDDRFPGAPDWTQLIVGSEGTLGIILDAELKVRPMPNARRFRAFRFRSLKDGLRGMRAVMQAGLLPIVLRLYDPFDSLIALGKEEEDPGAREEGPVGALRSMLSRTFKKPTARLTAALSPLTHAAKRAAMMGGLAVPALTNRIANAAPSPCLLIVGMEGVTHDGTDSEIQSDLARAIELLTREGGIDSGSRLGEAWLEKRYAVGFKQTKMMNLGAWVDTMEVATTWDRLEGLYDNVRRAVTPNAFIMAHFSHAYREGCSIYFTMAGHKKDHLRAEQHYERTWELAMDSVIASGGTISHHHGVGLHKMAAMTREHGAMLKCWHAIKKTLDPHGIMNPGKLFPSETVDSDPEPAEMDLRRRAP
jgi:alkyldihydroxyacetonephosphate synthase